MILSKVRNGKRVEHYETVRRTKDGRFIDVSLTVSPIRDETGKVIGASKILRNITQQKKVAAEREQALRERDELLKREGRTRTG